MTEEVRGLDRLKEIMRLAHRLNWVYPPNKTSYPLMQLSEVEKCMLAMYDDSDLNRMREWVEDNHSSEQTQEEVKE